MKEAQISSIQDFIDITTDMSDVASSGMENTIQRPYSSNTAKYGKPPLVYLMDYTQLKYHFISIAAKNILGYSLDYFKQGGIHFTFNIMHPNDLALYSRQIFTKNFSFLKKIPAALHKEYVFTHNFRLKNRQGLYHTLLQEYSIIQSSSDGTPLVFLCSAVDITHWKDNPGILHRIERNVSVNGLCVRELIFEKYFREQSLIEMLTKRELEIVKMICGGYSSERIASTLNLSVLTVNNHRKNILNKSGCNSIAGVVKSVLADGFRI